jgi:hypothetical protein
MALKLGNSISRKRFPADDWDRTIVSFQSPYRLKDLCIDQSQTLANNIDKSSRQEFKLRLATNEDRRKSASILVEKMYTWRGYGASQVEHNPYRLTLVAYTDDRVVGTLTLGMESPSGLMVDELYKEDIEPLRKQGRRVAELTKLAVDETLGSKEVLAALFHIAFIYAFHIHKHTDFVIEVNPRHVAFYKRMLGFEKIGEEKMCPRVNAPAVLLRLNFDYIAQQINRLGGLRDNTKDRSLYPYGFSKEDELGIAKRLQEAGDV